jgi:septal ring factor EnvC (AmiA/AmiB activator)
MREKPQNTFVFAAATIMVAMLLGGCQYFTRAPAGKPAPQVDSSAAKYDAGATGSLTSVESSLLLSEKYAALAVDSEKIRHENKRLTDENVQLVTKDAKLQADLDQTAKELKEANSMLIDMRIELNNWKNSVLGFREEMRESQKTQLEALLKIMQILGGENRPDQPSSPEKPDGEPNSKK